MSFSWPPVLPNHRIAWDKIRRRAPSDVLVTAGDSRVSRRNDQLPTSAIPWVDLIREMDTAALEALRRHPPPIGNRRCLVAFTLFARARISVQAARVLIESGLIGDARTVLRGAAEGAIALCGLAADETFLARMIEDQRLKAGKHARITLERNSAKGTYTDEDLAELRRRVADGDSVKAAGAKEIKWNQVAQGHCPALYDFLYRPLSQDGVHVTLDALMRHWKLNPGEELLAVKIAGDFDGAMDALRAAWLALHWAMRPFADVVDDDELRQRLEDLGRKYDAEARD